MDKSTSLKIVSSLEIAYDSKMYNDRKVKEIVLSKIRSAILELNTEEEFYITSASVEEKRDSWYSWNCSRADFSEVANFDISGLSDQEIDRMVDEVDRSMLLNDCVAECFWLCVQNVAENHGLKTIE